MTKQRSNKKQHGKKYHKNKSCSDALTTSHIRIIGGQFKRRNIQFIHADGLRPTPDRVRETLFNWLMHHVYDASVLDACAGSGVLGFECLSRGASYVHFIEANAQQYRQLLTTVNDLNLNEQSHITHGQAEQLIPVLATQHPTSSSHPFDLVFIDPPYALNLWIPILDALTTSQSIHPDTLIYLEADRPIDALLQNTAYATTLKLIKHKKMGQVFGALAQYTGLDLASKR